MTTTINADTATGGAIITGDASGSLALQSAGTTALTATSGNLTVAQKLTATGTASIAGMKIGDVLETATVSATAATGTIAYDVTTQAVLYYTTSASGNWTVNFRASSGTTLDSLLATGESVTVAFLVTQGATAYYNSAVQVDGASVTPKYQGGTAYAAGNASSVDVYMYTIIKTGSAAFTVFTSQTKFA